MVFLVEMHGKGVFALSVMEGPGPQRSACQGCRRHRRRRREAALIWRVSGGQAGMARKGLALETHSGGSNAPRWGEAARGVWWLGSRMPSETRRQRSVTREKRTRSCPASPRAKDRRGSEIGTGRPGGGWGRGDGRADRGIEDPAKDAGRNDEPVDRDGGEYYERPIFGVHNQTKFIFPLFSGACGSASVGSAETPDN